MRKYLVAAALISMAVSVPAAPLREPAPEAGFYDLKARTILGKQISLSEYKGKVLLVVNTASRCGFTPQYKSLQTLYEKYKEKGFFVLGFPSNDFFRQEPGKNEEIKKFCELNYGVTFPLFEKGPVKGKATQPVFRFLKGTPVGGRDGEIGWNFTKFLIDREGRMAARFPTRVDPGSPEAVSKIEELLGAQTPRKN